MAKFPMLVATFCIMAVTGYSLVSKNGKRRAQNTGRLEKTVAKLFLTADTRDTALALAFKNASGI